MPDQNRIRWTPPIELTPAEQAICRRCKRTGRMFSFLRRHRHELFPEELQARMAAMYADSPLGKPPVAPALLATVTLLQAVDGVSDAGAVEESVFDRRWQMVLDCLGAETPVFSQGVLVDFRRRLLEHNLVERLVEQSVRVAKETGGFGYKNLRVALDIDWDDKDEQQRALQALLDEVAKLQAWLEEHLTEAIRDSGVQAALVQLALKPFIGLGR